MSRSSFKKLIASSVAGAAALAGGSSTALAIWPPQDGQEKEVAIVVKAESVASDDDEKRIEVEVDVPQPKRWLGIQLKKVEGDLATFLGNDKGIFIISVYPDSPAEAAGLEAGDVILSANDKELAEMPQLLEVLADLDDEEEPKVKLNLLSKGEKKSIEIVPSERPEMKEFFAKDARIILQDSSEAKELHNELLQRLGNEEFKILRLGVPAMLGSDDELNVTLQRDEDGKKFKVSVQKEGEGPAKVKVIKDGKVQEFEVDDIDDLPKDIRVIVEPALGGKGVKLNVNKVEDMVSDVITVYGSNSEDLDEMLATDEITARIEAIAKEAAEKSKAAREQSRAATERVRSIVRGTRITQSAEVDELRELVEKLQSEIKELRKQLNDK